MKRLSYLFLSAALFGAPALAQDVSPDAASATPPAATAPEAAATAPEAAPAAAAEAAPAAPPAAEAAAPSPASPLDSRIMPAPAGKAQIVFFRPSAFLGSAVSFTIKEGETDVAKVTNGSYYVYVTDPGDHTYRVKSEATDTLTLELDEGETYYVKQTMDMGVMLYRPNMTPSDAMTFASLPKLKLAKPPKPAKS